MSNREQARKYALDKTTVDEAKVYAILALADSIEDSIIKLAKVIDKKKMS